VFRHEVVGSLARHRVIGIIRTDGPDSALDAAVRVLDAGLAVVEITLTTPGALDVIRELAARYPDALVGAGTVLDAASCRLAVAAGARFVVSPSLEPETLRMARRHGAASVPGVATPTEAMTAIDEGADAVKLFPASALGPSYVREVRAALPQLPVVPTGGIRPDDVGDWLQAGALAVGLGSALTKTDDVAGAVRTALTSREA
jgi:2-dehydro-3-deoxyphosphogluconate aldolase/(4S)-4-hydroxy-2-oxoglutarate aldolase